MFPRELAAETAQPTSVDDLVVVAATWAALVMAAGLLCCLALAFIEAVVVMSARSRTGWRLACTPQWSRRVVFTLCGLSMMAPGLATGAPIAPGSHGHHGSCEGTCAGRLDGLPLPDLPVANVEGSAFPSGMHIVEPGECLWSIAHEQLRDSDRNDTAAAIARRVHQLYSTNRAVIGKDPDLIFPGTPLTAPEAPS
ncbi:MAG: hypothetical protein ABJA81_03190 [Nocardioidaceae bacterium]